jgi:hypothetical protein
MKTKTIRLQLYGELRFGVAEGQMRQRRGSLDFGKLPEPSLL